MTGAWPLALASLAALTFVLSADFNEDVLYRRVRGEAVVTEPSPAGEGPVAGLLSRVYHALFAPQDRALQGIATKRLERLLAGVTDDELITRATLAYHDGPLPLVLANLGLSTQLAVLGVCLVLSAPEAYLWLALGFAALVPLLQVSRERRARRLLQAAPRSVTR